MRMFSIKSAVPLIVGMVFLGSAGTDAAQESRVEMPSDLQTITSENAADLKVIGEIPIVGDSLFTSPAMDTLFTFSHPHEGSIAAAYTFPDLEPITEFPSPLSDFIKVSTPQSPTKDAYFMPDGTTLLIMRRSNGISLYDTQTRTATVNENLWVSDAFSVSPHGLIATTHYDFRTEEKFLCLIEIQALAAAPTDEQCQPFQYSVAKMIFWNDGKQLLMAGTKRLLVYDVSTREITKTFAYALDPFYGAMALLPATNPDDTLPTVLLAQEGYVLSLNLATGAQRTFPNRAARMANTIIPLDNGSRLLLLVPSEQGNYWSVMVLDTATKQPLLDTDIFGGDAFLLSPDAALAVIGRNLYDLQTFQPIFTFGGDDHPLSFTPDGLMLFVSNSTASTIQVYGVPQR